MVFQDDTNDSGRNSTVSSSQKKKANALPAPSDPKAKA